MSVYQVDCQPDSKKRKPPRELSSVEMRGRWAFHAYVAAPNREANLLFQQHGFAIAANGRTTPFSVPMTSKNQGVYWSPDSKHVTFWAPIRPEHEPPEGAASQGLAVLSLNRITAEMAEAPNPVPAPYEIVYFPSQENAPFGLEWSPSGKAIYVIERGYEDAALYTQIVRVPFPRGEPTVIAKMGGMIDFFMPPVSRFEHGGGPSARPYWIVFGHPRGLFIVDPKGRHVQRLANVPAVGLHNIEWHPGRENQLALYFKRGMLNAKGEQFKGVYLLHLDRLGKPEAGELLEHVYPDNDVHTLWYSSRGRYVSWASGTTIHFRESKPSGSADAAPPVRTIEPAIDGDPLDVKGYAWHEDERRLAVTAGNYLLLYNIVPKPDPEAPPPEPYFQTSLGRATTHFVAEPAWVGDDVMLSSFEDLGDESERFRKFDFEAVVPEEDPTKADPGATRKPGKPAGASTQKKR